MRWVPTPTESYSDHRLARAGERAEILHRRAWDWSGHQETDGFVPAEMVTRLCPTGAKQRISALLEVGIWVEVEGGYRLADWDSVMEDMRSLALRRKADAERQRQKRQRDARRDSGVDASRHMSRDSPHAEEIRDSPLTPQAPPGGDCNPDSPIHTNCRGCHTTPRQRAAAAAAEVERQAAADLAALEARRRDVEWCGAEDCDPRLRKLKIPGGLIKCPSCHPDLVAGPLPERPALVAVGAR